MKVLYDSQIFSLQKFGGISRYIYELIYNNKGLYETVLAGKYFENKYLSETKFYKDKLFFDFKYKKYLLNEYNKKFSKEIIKENKYDILHPTYYDTYFMKINKKPYVIDAHDMIQELFPINSIAQKKIREKKSIVMHNASAIIAVSENTKKDLLKLYPEIQESKVHVCYRGSFWESINKKQNQDNYILFTGQRSFYKNFINFVKAVAPLLKKYNIRLICTGSPFSKSEITLFEELDIYSNIKNVFANDSELKNLYAHAICFVYPSLYEGFGVPILESWAMKCPIALSSTSCFPEIAENAGLYFDPNNIDDIKDKVEQLINDSKLQNDLINKGTERIKKFNWSDKIDETFSIYNSL